ncbi:hypothetical protein TNCV_451501 [Trichonephila clavipes]|nr:hypothetical protein TNCV_451501 [Trichonephila clavipes]
MIMEGFIGLWNRKHCYGNSTGRFSNFPITDRTSRRVITTLFVHFRKLQRNGKFSTIMRSELRLKIRSASNPGAYSPRESIMCRGPLIHLFKPTRRLSLD